MAQAIEVPKVPVDAIRPEENPRRTFTPAALDELTNSVRRRGVITPLCVRPLNDGAYGLIDGERRWRAAKKAGLNEVPVCIRVLTDEEAREERLIANLQRVDLPVMEESDAFRALQNQGKSRQEIAAIASKPERYVHEKLMLQRLVARVRGLVESDVVPLHYALALARVPAARQEAALDECFLPLFKGPERYQRQYLRPLRDLEQWMQAHVRLDPKGTDTEILLPDLAAEVQRIESQKKHLLLHLSSLFRHVDRTNPPLLLAQQWKYAESREARCEYARAGVIELGEGRGRVVKVCIAKDECKKHWPKKKPAAAAADRARREDQERRHAAIAAREAADKRWKEELKPLALKQLAMQVRRAALTRETARWLLEELQAPVNEVAEYVGPIATLPKDALVGALIVGVAIRRSWRYDDLRPVAKRFHVKLTPPTSQSAKPTVKSPKSQAA